MPSTHIKSPPPSPVVPAKLPASPPSPPPAANRLPSSTTPEPTKQPSQPDVPRSPSDVSIFHTRNSLDVPDVDMETFQQILDLDDDDHEFSKGMIWAYFSQATDTFKDMDKALKGKDLGKLSSLGHFLKGSSAALGLSKVQKSCEKIQHYGHLRDEEAEIDLPKQDALHRIEALLKQVNKEYAAAEVWLKTWYEENAKSEPEQS